MIGRRAFFGALVAAPAVAKAAIEEGASVLSGNHAIGTASDYPGADGFGADVDPTIEWEHKVNDVLWRARREGNIRRDIVHGINTAPLPEKIRGRKSWSPAFKEHVFIQERLDDYRKARAENDLTTEAKVALIKKLGFGDLLK